MRNVGRGSNAYHDGADVLRCSTQLNKASAALGIIVKSTFSSILAAGIERGARLNLGQQLKAHHLLQITSRGHFPLEVAAS